MDRFRALTQWGRVTHMCVSRLTITGSDNGLSPGRRQAIIWTNAEILLIVPLGTNFSEHLIETLTFSFTKMRLKVSSAKWRPFCLGLNVLKCLGLFSPLFRSLFRLNWGWLFIVSPGTLQRQQRNAVCTILHYGRKGTPGVHIAAAWQFTGVIKCKWIRWRSHRSSKHAYYDLVRRIHLSRPTLDSWNNIEKSVLLKLGYVSEPFKVTLGFLCIALFIDNFDKSHHQSNTYALQGAVIQTLTRIH